MLQHYACCSTAPWQSSRLSLRKEKKAGMVTHVQAYHGATTIAFYTTAAPVLTGFKDTLPCPQLLESMLFEQVP